MRSARVGFFPPEQAAPTTGSWDDWTTSDVGETQTWHPTITTSRDVAQVGFISDDTVVNFLASGSTPFYFDYQTTITIDSSGNMSFNTDSVSSTQPLNFTGVGTAELETLGKVIVSNTTTAYIVGEIANATVEFGNLTASNIANATTMSNYNIFPNPDDETDTIWWDETGDTNYITLNTSTNVLTWSASGTAPSNAKAGCGFWTLGSGTRKFAFLYYDTVNTDWRVRHYAEDLSSYSDTTLNGTPDPAGTANKFHTWRQKENVALHIVDDNSTLPCFVVKYDGSSFTQYTSQNLSVPSGVTTQVRSVSCIYYMEDDTWGAIIEWENPSDTTQRLAYVYLLRVETDGSVTELGKLALAPAVGGSSTNVKGGIALTTDRAWAVVASEAVNSGTATPIYSVLKRPGGSGPAPSPPGPPPAEGAAVTLTSNGDIKLSTAQSRFGYTSSLSPNTTSGYWSVSSGAYDFFDFGTSDFTVEFWLWIGPGAITNNIMELMTNNNTSGGFGLRLGSNFGASNYNAINIFARGTQDQQYANYTWNTSEWYYVVVQRSDSASVGVITFWVNGVKLTTQGNTNPADTTWDYLPAASGGSIQIGNAGGNEALNDSFIDELRVSRGVARYSTAGNISVPTNPFTWDSDTSLLVHFNGANDATTVTNDRGGL